MRNTYHVLVIIFTLLSQRVVLATYGAQLEHSIIKLHKQGLSVTDIHSQWLKAISHQTIRNVVKFYETHGIVPALRTGRGKRQRQRKISKTHIQLLLSIVEANPQLFLDEIMD
eukprot:c9680_g1_i1.p1 GENE.c9680_g1_i1~~c9680_g1_i1.p1  ORF type:complete len:113 (+),score=16.48 c9680_g1_i1:74-412(+)